MSTTEVREYRFVDDATRAKWGRGEWENEPDKIQWVDAATGLDCLMHRAARMGHWCGYVGVPEGHPLFAKDYGDANVDVHGGLTYADFCQVNPSGVETPERGICHVPFEGRPHRVWWLGFDCAHSGDRSPGASDRGEFYEMYRDRRYVERQCAELAGQLATYVEARAEDIQ